MAAITEDYVSFETAKLLKDKGFDEATNRYYNAQHDQIRTVSDTFLWHWNDEEFMKRVLMDGAIAIPTLQMAMKWLREVHGLHISLEPCYDYDSMHVVFLAFVQNVADVHEFMDGRKNVATYPNAEKSCELAIRYCLENLI